MSTRLKHLVLRLIIASAKGLRTLFQYLWLVLVIISLPIRLVVKSVFRPLILWLYSQYLRVVTRLKRSPFMQNKVLFLFGNRYFIHVIVATITVFVALTNLLQSASASGNTETFAEQSGLFAIVNPNGDLGEEIVEEGLIVNSNKTYYDTSGTMVASVPQLDPTAEPPKTVGEQIATADNGRAAALVSSSTIETASGIRGDFTEYRIKDGDAIGSIAERFNITVNTLLWANNLQSNSYIKPGDTLSIPPVSGYVVQIQSGDTLTKLVEKHKGNYAETVKVAGGETIAVGSKVVIADGQPYVEPKPEVKQPSYIARSGGTTSPGVNVNRNVPAQVSGGNLNWPAGCHSTPTTYWGHGLARDIPCPSGTPIYAMHDGVATIPCSGGYCGGYGNYITVSGGGYKTLYAHQSAFNITSGQTVSRGQVIGFVGSTGRSTGPHVHIQVWVNGAEQPAINFLR